MSRRTQIAAAAALAAVAAASVPAARADDVPLGAVDPEPQEQLGIYEINRARANPAAYGTEIGFDLSGVAAAPPLAVNRNLTGSARFHALEMFHHHYFSHTSAVTGDGANAMATQNGYDLFGNGLAFPWGSTNNIESNARGVNRYPTSTVVVRDLIIDEGVGGAGHRVHLLAMHEQYRAHREIGFGRAEGKDSFPEFGLPKLLPTRTYSIHTAYRDEDDLFLTGVVFADRNGNRRYDAGEGLGGVIVQVLDGPSTTSQAQGGWSIPSGPGSFLVRCQGGEFAGTAHAFAAVTDSNVAIDFHSGRAGGEVGFAWRDGIPAGPDVTMNASKLSGPAPLDVDFTASGLSGGVYSWDFADGANEQGAGASHEFTVPGIYPVVVTGIDAGGAGSALGVIAAMGPPGDITTPGSTGLGALKGSAKRKIKVAGKDLVKVAATLELPGGFVPVGATVNVCAAGVTRGFTLDAKGKGTDGEGGKIVLKAAWPKDGTGVPAGTVAKLTATMKGALGGALEAAGLRDRTESRTVPARVVVLLDGATLYAVSASMTVTASEGKAGKATILPGE